jgi:hypothetical protein
VDTLVRGMAELNRRLTEGLYVATAALLIAHQIDSAFWQEWRLFGMKGDIQGFVLSNIVLIVPVLYGLVALVRTPRVGAWFALALSAAGVFALCIHTWFLAQGRPEFRVPVSIGVLVTALLASLALAWQSVKLLRQPARS